MPKKHPPLAKHCEDRNHIALQDLFRFRRVFLQNATVAESPRVWRNFLMAVLRLCSKSTKVSEGQSRSFSDGIQHPFAHTLHLARCNQRADFCRE